MKKDFTKIACVLDRSGSMGMAGKIQEARSGFNTFLREQKGLPGTASITVTIFDTEFDTIYSGDIQTFEGLTESNYYPRGGTALLDALGQTIVEVGEELAALPEEERPDKVIFVVITDGQENSSHEYRKEQITDMIKRQREVYNWEFVFMGADENSIQDAQSWGFAHTTQVADSAIGVLSAYTTLSATVSGYRITGNVEIE